MDLTRQMNIALTRSRPNIVGIERIKYLARIIPKIGEFIESKVIKQRGSPCRDQNSKI